jgi:metal-responsive CopG/Arc/MetJ family transcriptional regulator
MSKKKIFTISIDESLVARLRGFTRKSRYKNKSHFVEEAMKKFLKKEKRDE